MALTSQEAECVGFACSRLRQLLGGDWRAGDTLDDEYPAEPSPEVIVTDEG